MHAEIGPGPGTNFKCFHNNHAITRCVCVELCVCVSVSSHLYIALYKYLLNQICCSGAKQVFSRSFVIRISKIQLIRPSRNILAKGGESRFAAAHVRRRCGHSSSVLGGRRPRGVEADCPSTEARGRVLLLGACECTRAGIRQDSSARTEAIFTHLFDYCARLFFSAHLLRAEQWTSKRFYRRHKAL